MRRDQFDHVLRAAAAIADETEFVVIGSQALLGVVQNPPEELLVSVELDLYPLKDPAKADLIDGSIGELSPFHETFGYHAHGVGPETAVLPAGWRERLVAYRSQGVVAHCLSLEDLAVSKLAAGRPKDLEYVQVLLKTGFLERSAVRELASSLKEPMPAAVRERLDRLSA